MKLFENMFTTGLKVFEPNHIVFLQVKYCPYCGNPQVIKKEWFGEEALIRYNKAINKKGVSYEI